VNLIAELETEFAKGRIYEATLITDDGWHLMGMCDLEKDAITIDPKVAIVSTLLHELIHRRHPLWEEARVRRTETRALRLLSQHDIQTWYRRYRRAVRKRRPVDAISYEG
jgi:hypothetical protein